MLKSQNHSLRNRPHLGKNKWPILNYIQSPTAFSSDKKSLEVCEADNHPVNGCVFAATRFPLCFAALEAFPQFLTPTLPPKPVLRDTKVKKQCFYRDMAQDIHSAEVSFGIAFFGQFFGRKDFLSYSL